MSIVITAIKKIYEEEGVEIYLDKYRYYCLAEDYISDQDDQFLEQLYYCVENNILKILYQVHMEKSPQEREKLIQKAKTQFSQYQTYSVRETDLFFKNYMDAFGWKRVEPKKKNNTSKSKNSTQSSTVNSSTTSNLKEKTYEELLEDCNFEEMLRRALEEIDDPSPKQESTPPKPRVKRHHFLHLFFLIIIVIVGYFGIGLYQSHSYIANIEAGVLNETSFFETFPLMNHVLNWKLKTTVDKAVKSYNKGKTEYEEAYAEVSVFTSSSTIGEYAQQKLALLEKLSTSKQSYEIGMQESDNEYYVDAAWYLSHVIKDDSLYKKAQKSKKKIKKNFTKEITSRIENAVSDANYDEAVRLAGIGGTCYPSDDKLSGLKRAGDDCGNPFIYQIVHNIYKDIKKVEKDKDNKKQDCYAMIVFKLDDTHFLLGSLFGTVEGAGVSDYSIVCYDITLNDISKISQSEYKTSMEGKGQLEKLEFRWDPDISKKDKEEALYEQFIKLGPNYEGDTSGISYISKSESAQNSSNQSSVWTFLRGIISQYGAAIIVIIIVLIIILF